jgi:hypothetical protein
MPESKNYSPILCYDSIVTFDGSATSNAIDLFGTAPVGVIPATGMTTADYTFLISPTLTGTYGAIQNDEGTAISATSVAANACGDLGSNFPVSARFVKLVSSVSQTGTAIIVTRPV